jgi:hypothetical protein
MHTGQIFPGHENLESGQRQVNSRDSYVDRTRSNAVLHARGCVAQKIGLAMVVVGGPLNDNATSQSRGLGGLVNETNE